MYSISFAHESSVTRYLPSYPHACGPVSQRKPLSKQAHTLPIWWRGLIPQENLYAVHRQSAQGDRGGLGSAQTPHVQIP
jgi:hypothetical protein